jgi:hypothetical protein
VDAVSEFQISRNVYDAQYGRTAGAVINLTTKSGSQEYHGTAFCSVISVCSVISSSDTRCNSQRKERG